MSRDTVAGAPQRGKTHYGDQTINTADYGASVSLEGITCVFKDEAPPSSYGVRTQRSQAEVHAELVRNVSGIALLPSRVAVYSSGYRHKRVDGYVTVENTVGAGVVDDHLPAAGVPNGDLFWLIKRGPVLVRNDIAAAASAHIDANAKIVALTAATSQATTAGRIAAYAVTTNVTFGVSGAMNYFGHAISGVTSANTNTTVLVDVFFR